MNNNKNDEPALLAGCKGVFSKSSYISFGTAEKPEEFSRKIPDRDGFKGKQMRTCPPKEGRMPDTYFEKKHLWISEGANYVDRLKYQEVQKVKKKGFLTSDYSRRDEFSMTFRTEQYRSLLRMEDKFAKKALEKFSNSQKGGPGELTQQFQQTGGRKSEEPEVFLYDLVFEKFDAHTSGASNLARDTKNPTVLSPDRDLGVCRTTMRTAHAPPQDFHKPEYARIPIIRDTFFRKTNVFSVDGGAGLADSH